MKRKIKRWFSLRYYRAMMFMFGPDAVIGRRHSVVTRVIIINTVLIPMPGIFTGQVITVWVAVRIRRVYKNRAGSR
jgi:hypothetical protein